MRLNVLLINNNGCARKEIHFLCICITLVILISILMAFTHLITMLLYTGHQFMHCTVLLCVRYNVKLCCLFLSWFAKEANVAINSQWETGNIPRPQGNVPPQIPQESWLGDLQLITCTYYQRTIKMDCSISIRFFTVDSFLYMSLGINSSSDTGHQAWSVLDSKAEIEVRVCAQTCPYRIFLSTQSLQLEWSNLADIMLSKVTQE